MAGSVNPDFGKQKNNLFSSTTKIMRKERERKERLLERKLIVPDS